MIYFIQPADGGPVKIGYTGNLEVRHRQLEKHYGKSLAILATIDGGPQEERDLHVRFAHLRFGRTEQFQPGIDLLTFIGRPLFASMTDVVPIDPVRQVILEGAPIRVSRALASKLKAIANDRGDTVAEVADELFATVLDRAYAQMLRRLEGDDR